MVFRKKRDRALDYLVCDYTRLSFVTKRLVSIEKLQQLISTQIAAALVDSLTVQECPLQAPTYTVNSLHKDCIAPEVSDPDNKYLNRWYV